jgi:glycerol-3-phosphate dehydrogenase (NAD(P)+)
MNEQQIKEKEITIIGGGTMGTALAHLIAGNGYGVRLWVYEKELCDIINSKHENTFFLPGIKLSENIVATNSLKDALFEVDVVFSVTPSQLIRKIWGEAKNYLKDSASVVCASKGVETGTGKLLSDVFDEVLGGEKLHHLAYLSGPSFAKEILQGTPTTVVVASHNEALAITIQEMVSTSVFRIYTTDDVIGVELGGAIKNVIAIGVGIAEGLGFGINTRSAIITRGLAEITRLAVACGANPLTLSGLAGMGDLVLTCTGHLSRNLQVGLRLGKGEKLEDILSSTNMIAEGVATAHSALQLANSKGIEMPITRMVDALLKGEISPSEAVSSLMERPLRSEKE